MTICEVHMYAFCLALSPVSLLHLHNIFVLTFDPSSGKRSDIIIMQVHQRAHKTGDKATFCTVAICAIYSRGMARG